MSELVQVLRARFGHAAFRDGQEEVVRAVAAGEDCLVVMPTGAGKSLCYQLPALVRGGTTVVVSPLIALMKDQVDSLCGKGVEATFINSSLAEAERRERLAALQAGRVQVVYVAPERFSSRFLDLLARVDVRLLALDEAHCLSQWGHDFRPDYLRLGEVRNALGRPATVALTATATPRVQDDIVRVMGMDGCRRFVRGFDRRNIQLEVAECRNAAEKDARVADLVLPGPTLVYCATRRNVEQVLRGLRERGVEAAMYHAGLDTSDRIRVQDAFMGGRVPVVVATNAFGMGVDKSNIRTIVHYDLPGTVEAYYQEVGRAGRDGAPSRAVLLHRPEDRRIQEFFIQMSHPSPDQVAAVYDALRARMPRSGDAPARVECTPADLVDALPEDGGAERVVEACLRVLEREGWIRRAAGRDAPARVTSLVRGSRMPGLPGRVLAAVQARLEPGETLHVRPEALCSELDARPAELAAALRVLESQGLVRYQPPGREGGVELQRPREPLALDTERMRRRRAWELEKLDRMVDYVHASCRRHYLLTYFGEQPPFQNCGTCDACRREPTAASAPRPLEPAQALVVRKVLACIDELRGEWSPSMIARVLTGSQDRAVLGFGFQRLASHGALASWKVDEVVDLVQALVRAGALTRRTELRVVGGRERSYAVLALAGPGRSLLHGDGAGLRMCWPSREVPGPRARPVAGAPRVAGDLLAYLKEVRRQLARADDVPPYVVAPDRSLEDMAAQRPASKDAMLRIHGMGPRRFQKYGAVLLEAVRTWTGRT